MKALLCGACWTAFLLQSWTGSELGVSPAPELLKWETEAQRGTGKPESRPRVLSMAVISVCGDKASGKWGLGEVPEASPCRLGFADALPCVLGRRTLSLESWAVI